MTASIPGGFDEIRVVLIHTGVHVLHKELGPNLSKYATDVLRKKGRLSKPLCYAIDGVGSDSSSDEDLMVSEDSSTPGRKREAFKRAIRKTWRDTSLAFRPSYDLAADYATGGFSGAAIAGLVRCAGSLALARARKDGSGVDGLLITLQDAKEALKETKE